MKITRLFDFPQFQLENAPLKVMFKTKYNGVWESTSTEQYVNQANRLSRGLLKLGIKPEDKIAIVSHNNRTEWHIVDTGVLQIGAVTVPVYPTVSSADYDFIFNDSGVKFCFVSNDEMFEKVNKIKKKVSSLVAIYSFEQVDGCANWEEILEMGGDDSTQYEVEDTKKLVKEEDLASLIYTSGTTGRPKGVKLSHQNITSNVMASVGRFPDFKAHNISDPVALSFLPICHIFERMIVYTYMKTGVSVVFAESIETLSDDMKEIKPEVMTVVPRLIEKIYAKILDKGTEAGGVKKRLLDWSIDLVEDYDPRAKQSLMFKIKHGFANKVIFSKWKEAVGGNLLTMVSGSAALSNRLSRIFHGAGIPISEGYGLTETSPVISVTTLDLAGKKIGSVGKPLSNLDVRIESDGEIVVKGPSITKGYWNLPEKTAESFTKDGYFMTGDIGAFDEDGFLYITDRKKEMFKTSGGKYVAPQVLENLMVQSRFIEQIMVVGEGEKMPCALVQPDFNYLREWSKKKNLADLSDAELARHPEVIANIEKDIAKVNATLGKWEQVKLFKTVTAPWTIEAGVITPTMKLKRKVIKAQHMDLYNEMYGHKE